MYARLYKAEQKNIKLSQTLLLLFIKQYYR